MLKSMVRPLPSESASDDGPPKSALLESSPLPDPTFAAGFAGGDAGLLGFGVGADDEDLEGGCGLTVGCCGASWGSISMAPSRMDGCWWGVGSGLGGRDWTAVETGAGWGELCIFTNEAVCCGTGCRFACCTYDTFGVLVRMGCGGSMRLCIEGDADARLI